MRIVGIVEPRTKLLDIDYGGCSCARIIDQTVFEVKYALSNLVVDCLVLLIDSIVYLLLRFVNSIAGYHMVFQMFT